MPRLIFRQSRQHISGTGRGCEEADLTDHPSGRRARSRLTHPSAPPPIVYWLHCVCDLSFECSALDKSINFDVSTIMELPTAVQALSALGQESRLRVFRLLIRRGPEGMPAGDIAQQLNVPANTMSSHLAVLSRAGLVISRKQGRSVIYGVDVEGTRKLLSFLVEDCCQGKRKVCQPLIASALAECC
ncbi:MAG: ArsR/SmtB family transcription factor [Methyloceanibacter sp.]